MQTSSRKSGFTLMEIMVVIIVIAVLASVAGPMIGSITDQGKASATKASMQNLKTAFVNFTNDLGKQPHADNTLTSTAFDAAWANNSTLRVSGTNCFIASDTPASNSVLQGAFKWQRMNIAKYQQRWKGPYIDGNVEDFLKDSWEGYIDIYYQSKGLWLHSPGADGNADPKTTVTAAGYGQVDGQDDIVMSIAKVKFN